MALLGLGSAAAWTGSAIVPTVARAYIARQDVAVEHRAGDTFANLLRRGEALARSTVQQAFDSDPLVTDVSIMVLGQNGSAVAPLLTVEVSRDEWSQLPDPTEWAQYFASARGLLGLDAPPPMPESDREEPELGTGDVQVTLRWSTTDDLDLAVTGPEGARIFFGEPQSPSGGQLDVDANAGCGESNSSPVENIFWPTGEAPEGQYTAEVNLFARCGEESGPIEFEMTILTLGETRTETGTVDSSNPTVTFDFSVPPNGDRSEDN